MAGSLATTINLPQWDAEDPTYWFVRAEGNFELLKGADGTTLPLSDKEKLTLVGNAIPAMVMKRYKADVVASDYEAFRSAICGAMTKTDAQLFEEIVTAKVKPGQLPSSFLQSQKVRLGLLSSKDRDGWILKHSLERQMPATISAAMAGVIYEDKDPQSYLGHIDTIYANLGLCDTGTSAMLCDNNPTNDQVIAAIEDANLSTGATHAIKEAYRRTGSWSFSQSTNGFRQTSSRRNWKCWFHRRYKEKAYKCRGIKCTDRGTQLSIAPDKRSSRTHRDNRPAVATL